MPVFFLMLIIAFGYLYYLAIKKLKKWWHPFHPSTILVWRRQSHLPTPFAFVYFSVYSISGNGLWEWRRKCQSLPLQRNHRQNRIDKRTRTERSRTASICTTKRGSSPRASLRREQRLTSTACCSSWSRKDGPVERWSSTPATPSSTGWRWRKRRAVRPSPRPTPTASGSWIKGKIYKVRWRFHLIHERGRFIL